MADHKRDLGSPNGDKRYIQRDEKGRFKESQNGSRSLDQDRGREGRSEGEREPSTHDDRSR